jgi:hypothetical protein
MIERTMYAASTDETRYNLNGVYVERLAETGKLRMVATDGHRLAYVDRALGDGLASLAASGRDHPAQGARRARRSSSTKRTPTRSSSASRATTVSRARAACTLTMRPDRRRVPELPAR